MHICPTIQMFFYRLDLLYMFMLSEELKPVWRSKVSNYGSTRLSQHFILAVHKIIALPGQKLSSRNRSR